MGCVRVIRRFAAGTVLAVLVAAGVVLAGAGQASAAAPAATAPLGAPASGTLTQARAGGWTTTVYLETAALCAGAKAAGNKFTLVTAVPASFTDAAAPQYPADSPVSRAPCGTAADSQPLTAVTLTFPPSAALSAVPQTATLVVTPPPVLLAAGDIPAQVPLTVRRTVEAWDYVSVPALCGAGLAVVFVLSLLLFGVPAAAAATGDKKPRTAALEPGATAERVTVEDSSRTVVTRVTVTAALSAADLDAGVVPRREVSEVTEVQKEHRESTADETGGDSGPGADPGDGPPPRAGFWQTPLYAGTTWSFSDSWATSVTPLTAVVAAVLAQSGALAFLVPGVDLSKFALAIALAGMPLLLAPLLFSVLNGRFPGRAPAVAGEVIAARLWVMVLASCLTVFSIGAELCYLGWSLGHRLLVAAVPYAWIPFGVVVATGVLFVFYSVHAIRTLAATPSGGPKDNARNASFMM
jgi:hypothetical protein